MEFWFRRKYGLTPNDPRFLSLTREEIVSDYWAHQYFDNPPKDEICDDDFDLQAEIDQINRQAEAAAAAGADKNDEWEPVIDDRYQDSR